MPLHEILDSILSSFGVAIYCGIIVLWMLIGAFFLYIRINPLKKDLCNAIEQIQNRSEAPELFVSEFQDLSEKIYNISNMKHLWQEFQETLVFPSGFETKPRICNTVESNDFFNQSTLLGEHVDLRFYNSLPNILTGIGILGTFLGLVAGIYMAKEGLVSGNLEELNTSLHGLLDGASLAFLTSIAGILCSITFSYFEKWHIHRYQQKINYWNRQLDKRICRITPESIAKDQLSQLNKQTELSEGLANQMAFELSNVIGQVFEQGMDQKLLPAIEKLTSAVEDLGKNQHKSNEDFMREMVTEFKQFLSASAGQEMQALTQTLSTMREGLGTLLDRMGETQTELSEATLQIGTTLREGSNKYIENMEGSMTNMLEKVAEFGEALRGEFRTGVEDALSKLDAASRSLSDNVQQLDRTSSSLNTVLEHTGNVMEDFRMVASSLRDTKEGMQKVVDDMGQTAQSLQGYGEKIANTTHGMGETVSKIAEIHQRYSELQEIISSTWEDYAKRFEDADAELERVFKTMHSGVEQFVASTQKYLENMDVHASNVTNTFAGAVNELRELLEELSDYQNTKR